MITLGDTTGDIPLSVPDPDGNIAAFVRRHIPQDRVYPFLRRSWPGFGLAGITWPTGFRDIRPVELGKFIWPVGACRWSYGHFLSSATTAGKVRDLAFGTNGKQNNAINLKMTSPGLQDDEPAVKTVVYLMPPTPISQLTGGNFDNLYIITVVDSRYYWWNVPTPASLVTGDSTSWGSVFTALGGALTGAGVESDGINVDTIPTAYLKASPQMMYDYEVIPPLIDAAAFNCGHRLVRQLSGAVGTQSFATAQATMNDDFDSHENRTSRAGGSRFVVAL